jgi:hypothetical protein
MKTLVTDLFTYLRDALGEAPTAFQLSCRRGGSIGSLDDVDFSDFDDTSAARLALLGGELRGEAEIEERIVNALREIAESNEDSVCYPEGDDGCEVGFDLSVVRDGCKVTGTITVFDSVTEASDDNETNSHELSEELAALLAEKKITAFTATFNGGGDSGEMSDLSFETSDGPCDDAKVKAALARFVDDASNGVSIDWYNNEGGGGEITWQADSEEPGEAESCFYYNTEVEVSEVTPIELTIPEDIITATPASSPASNEKFAASV